MPFTAQLAIHLLRRLDDEADHRCLGRGFRGPNDHRGRAPALADGHVIEPERPILAAEEGLLLGNGDLSVSVYQTADQIIWRFGKGDVWDRRLDLSDDPKPAHISKIAHGIEVEGWKCPPYGAARRGHAEAREPRADAGNLPKLPPSYVKRPYPCPKPVGELALHFPPDQMGMTIRAASLIEEAKLLIECTLAVRRAASTWNASCPPRPTCWSSAGRWGTGTR